MTNLPSYPLSTVDGGIHSHFHYEVRVRQPLHHARVQGADAPDSGEAMHGADCQGDSVVAPLHQGDTINICIASTT